MSQSFFALILSCSVFNVKGYIKPTGLGFTHKSIARSFVSGNVIRPRTCLFALDYKDPVVAAEYAAVQDYDLEKIEEELMNDGIPVPATMDEVSARMMLVETRMRNAGKIGAFANEDEKTEFVNEYERALYEKPAFKDLIEYWQESSNVNAVNLAVDYLNNRRQAEQRYKGTDVWDTCTAAIETALNKKVEQVVTSGRISFSGLPAGLGEEGARSTFETFGAIKDFSDYETSDDFMTASGLIEFDEIDAAKAAIDKYDGVDMGLGTKLILKSLP